MKTFFSCYFIMATRKYKKQKKGNLKKKSLGKKKRSMKKRGKSLKKRGGNGDDLQEKMVNSLIHIQYEKHMDTTETPTEGLTVYKFLDLHEGFIKLDHGSCKKNFNDRKDKLRIYNIERIENCDKTKVLFYKGVLEDVLKYTKTISDMVFDKNQKGDNLLANKIETRFKSIIINYAEKLEKHAIKFVEQEKKKIVEQEKKKINELTEQEIEEAITKELTEVGITKELTKVGIKFKMEKPLLKFTNDENKSFKYYDDNVKGKLQKVESRNPEKKRMFQDQYMEKKDVYFHAFLVKIINLLNNEANLENVILIEYYKYSVNPLATNNRLTSMEEADE